MKESFKERDGKPGEEHWCAAAELFLRLNLLLTFVMPMDFPGNGSLQAMPGRFYSTSELARQTHWDEMFTAN